jgi:hypothetical protein
MLQVSSDILTEKGGSNADNVLADAYLKGIKDGINVMSALLRLLQSNSASGMMATLLL